MAHRASVGFGSKAADRAGESRILRGDAHLLAQRLRSEIRSARPHRSLKLRMNPKLVKNCTSRKGSMTGPCSAGPRSFSPEVPSRNLSTAHRLARTWLQQHRTSSTHSSGAMRFSGCPRCTSVPVGGGAACEIAGGGPNLFRRCGPATGQVRLRGAGTKQSYASATVSSAASSGSPISSGWASCASASAA